MDFYAYDVVARTVYTLAYNEGVVVGQTHSNSIILSNAPITSRIMFAHWLRYMIAKTT